MPEPIGPWQWRCDRCQSPSPANPQHPGIQSGAWQPGHTLSMHCATCRRTTPHRLENGTRYRVTIAFEVARPPQMGLLHDGLAELMAKLGGVNADVRTTTLTEEGGTDGTR